MDIKIGSDLPSISTKAKVFWGHKTSSPLTNLREDILKIEKTIEPHKLYLVLFLDKDVKTSPETKLSTFSSVLKTSLILMKGLVKQAVEVIKAIEVTPKLLDQERILVVIDIKSADVRERIKDFAHALSLSKPEIKEEKGLMEIETSFTPMDFVMNKIDFSVPTYNFHFQGNVDRDLVEFLKLAEVPEELKAYLLQIQLLLHTKNASLKITPTSSKILEHYSQILDNLKPDGKVKLPKMPIIKKVLGIGKEILVAKAQVVFAPESFVYEMEVSTSQVMALVEEFCQPPQ